MALSQKRSWYGNGKMKEWVSYQNGKADGKYRSWHENGQLWTLMFYREDRRDGELKLWRSDGNMASHGYYLDDQLIDPEFSSKKKLAILRVKRFLRTRCATSAVNSHLISDLAKLICQTPSS